MTSDLTALDVVRSDLRAVADPDRAVAVRRYFKTGPGEYGEGDQFLGVPVPDQRRCAKRHWNAVSLDGCVELLQSPLHEERSVALFMLVFKYEKGADTDRDAIFHAYLANTSFINNWDLVDASAPAIVGAHVKGRAGEVLEKLATSSSLWERRIAMIATFHHIKRNEFKWPLRIATTLVDDRHDLIQKAVGWMLREIGKRDQPAEESFLFEHYRTMPRTTLRYAIERFSPERRSAYLNGEVGMV